MPGFVPVAKKNAKTEHALPAADFALSDGILRVAESAVTL